MCISYVILTTKVGHTLKFTAQKAFYMFPAMQKTVFGNSENKNIIQSRNQSIYFHIVFDVNSHECTVARRIFLF